MHPAAIALLAGLYDQLLASPDGVAQTRALQEVQPAGLNPGAGGGSSSSSSGGDGGDFGFPPDRGTPAPSWGDYRAAPSTPAPGGLPLQARPTAPAGLPLQARPTAPGGLSLPTSSDGHEFTDSNGQEVTCFDIPGWTDSEGNTCAWYGEEATRPQDSGRCLVHGFNREHDGHTATTACCVCAGVKKHVGITPGNLFVYSLICAGCAFVYFERAGKKRRPLPDDMPPGRSLNAGDFKVKLHGCCEDVNTFIFTCMCQCVRIPDTYHAAGVMPFWEAFGWYTGCNVAAALTAYAIYGEDHPGASGNTYNLLLAACMALTFGRWRGKLLRHRLGGQQHPGDELFDVTIWFFASFFCCSICPAVQEAREVDMIAGQRPTLACGLEEISGDYEMVGRPVATGRPVAGDAAGPYAAPQGGAPQGPFSDTGHRLQEDNNPSIE